MALPSKLKYFNIFNDAEMYLAQAQSFTPAKLTRKTESYRGGGMTGAAQIDMGLDDAALDISFVIGGYEKLSLKQAGGLVDGVMLRFAGAFQRDDSDAFDSVEVYVRGRHKEFDRGTWSSGETNTTTISMACTYYKEVVNGEIIVEIDTINMIENIAGKDRIAKARRMIGL